MAATLAQQTWYAYRNADNDIILLGTVSATGWSLVFEIGTSQTGTPIYQLVPAVSLDGLTITVTIPAATSALLSASQYVGTLWRTNVGSKKPLAVGIIEIIQALSPP